MARGWARRGTEEEVDDDCHGLSGDQQDGCNDGCCSATVPDAAEPSCCEGKQKPCCDGEFFGEL